MTPKLIAKPMTEFNFLTFINTLKFSPLSPVTHLSLIVPCWCIAALVQATRG